MTEEGPLHPQRSGMAEWVGQTEKYPVLSGNREVTDPATIDVPSLEKIKIGETGQSSAGPSQDRRGLHWNLREWPIESSPLGRLGWQKQSPCFIEISKARVNWQNTARLKTFTMVIYLFFHSVLKVKWTLLWVEPLRRHSGQPRGLVNSPILWTLPQLPAS